MALIKIVAILLVVLPALIAASACQITVSQKLQSAGSKYNTYTGTINNVGSATAADVMITPSVSLRSLSGLKTKGNGYSLANAQVRTGIAAGGSFDFTYTVTKSKNVAWTATCTDAATPTACTTGAPASPTAVPTSPSSPTSKAATTAPTKAPTTAPTSKQATTAPTTSKKATTAPTAAPTTSKKATTAPTTGSKSATNAPSAGGRVCPSGTWWAPSPQTTYQWQLTGTIDTSYDVQMYDIDLFDNTAATISTLHSQGRVVVCYFSTQYEDWRPDASSFTSAVLGSNLDDWAGEKYVDIRSTVVRNILSARLDLAVSKGCDGVEPDNVDSYEASSGFPLTASDQINFNTWIANTAHSKGLSVGLKNDLDQSKTLEPSFDWALNEQCNEYDECDGLDNFISKGKAVFNTEYSGSASTICPKMVTAKFTTLLKSLSLDASIKAQCCTYETSPCFKAAYTCVSAPLARDVEEETENEVFAVKALETKELTTQEVPVAVNSAATAYASIAFVLVVAVVAALN